MKRITLILVAMMLVLAGCGGSSFHGPKPSSAKQLTVPCPPTSGKGYAGVCTAKRPTALGLQRAPAGGLLPDVSDWQGIVNWNSVKSWQVSHGWKPAGIFKMGEYSIDPFATRNASELHRLGMWTAGYWFVRNTGCGHEAALIKSVAAQLGIKVVFLDEEVPEAANYDSCLTPILRGSGLIVGTYSSPGSWPGGSNSGNPAWIATFGSSFGCLPWSCHPISWQFTDGKWGAVTFVPGIGTDDVNVDYGITKLGVVVPPHLFCFGSKAQLKNPTCKRVRAQVASLTRAEAASVGAFRARGCVVLAQRISWFSNKIKQQPHSSKLATRKRALLLSRQAYASRSCTLFDSRAKFFQSQINQIQKKY